MLKKLTAILMSLTLMLSVTAVFAAEAPTLVQTSKTKEITTAEFAMTDSTTPDTTVTISTNWTANSYVGRQMFIKADLSDYVKDGFVDSAILRLSGYKVSYVMNAYKVNTDWDASTITYNSMKSEIEALKAGTPDATVTIPSTESYTIDVAELINEDGTLNIMVELPAATGTKLVYGPDVSSSGSCPGVQIVVTNNVVSFEKRVQDSYKLSTSEFALTDSANPDTVVDAKAAKVYFASKEMFVKADLSAYSEEELSEAQLGFTNWGGSYQMEVYKLDDYVWDASTLTYNIAKEKIVELKAGTPDLSLKVGNSAWRYPIADLVDEEGQLNIMIVNHDTTSSKTLYGSESTYGPKILFTPYYTTAEAIVNNTAMKIKASAASYEAGTAAVPFAALYDSTGALSEVIMGSVITAGGAAQTTEIAITAAQATAASTIKVFMWADGTLVPLNDVVSQINK